MNLPGFGAEASLYKSKRCYNIRGELCENIQAGVTPARLSMEYEICPSVCARVCKDYGNPISCTLTCLGYCDTIVRFVTPW